MNKTKKLTLLALVVVMFMAFSSAIAMMMPSNKTYATDTAVVTEATADLTISTVAELKEFAGYVNAGDSYEGKLVVLANDIDLEFTAVVIGTKTNPFKGTFDGQGYTVSNLTIYENGSDSDYFADSDDCLGLFGVINTPAVVKNVTVDNPYIVGSSYVGGIVGMAYTGRIENCHVTGEIDIEGYYMVGGITGHGYAKIYDCSVIGKEGWDYSYVGATYKEANLEGDNVGGIVGHNAENNDIHNCTVKNVTVSGTRKVGGIVGITAQNTDISGCKVEDVIVETTATAVYAADNAKTMSIGGIVGQYMANGANDGIITDCSVSGLTFANENDVKVSAGAVTGGLRGTSDATVAPAETITVSGVNVSGVIGSTVEYSVVYVAKINDAKYATLQAAVNAVQIGGNIVLLDDITEDVSFTQKDGRAFTLDGQGNKFYGTISITAEADKDSTTSTFTVKNVNFVNNVNRTDSYYIIQSVTTNTYPHIAVDNCTFIDETNCGNVVAINLKSANNAVIKNCTGTNLHSFLQNTAGWNLTLENITLTNCARGMALGAINGATIKNVKIDASNEKYGIRIDGNYDNSNNVITFEDCEINAFIPVVVRKASTDFEIIFNGTNTMTAANTDGIWCAIGSDEYGQNGKLPTAPNCDVHVTLNDTGLSAKGVYGEYFVPVAQVGEVKYGDLHEAMTACKAGETVLLLSNVDLAGTTWEPVSFKGTFDGQNFTIFNLTINKPGVENTGFITSLNGTFKNVTFTNPTVTGGENTGVVAGCAGGHAALAQNITVNGTIKVETTHSGYARLGTIVGGWAYGNYENITVDGGDKEVSYLKHTGGGDGRYVGGIVGHADDVKSYVNCTVKNITISGGWLCGGIAGPGPASSITSGCAVENINVGADNSGGMFGWYYGSGTIEDSSVKDVTFTAGSTDNGAIGGYSNNTDATISNVTIENVANADGAPLLNHVAQIGSVNYDSLQAAIDAANGATITLLRDLTIVSDLADSGKGYFNIKDGQNVTLDLNGKKITATDNSNGNFILFYNYGTFTIKNGTIELTAKNNRAWNAESAIILNRGGELNVESGTYTHKGGTDMAFVVDNSGNYFGDAVTNIGIKPATARNAVSLFSTSVAVEEPVLTSSYTAIRNRMEQNSHGASGTAYLNIYSGTIDGDTSAIWAQAASENVDSPAEGEINVSGGTIGVINTARSAGAKSMTTISGGTVEAVKAEVGELTVTGGTVGTVTLLTADGEEADYLINEKDVYVQAVVKVGTTKYGTIEEAVAEITAGETLTLLADVTITADLTIPAGVILDGNGKTINGSIVAGGDITFVGHTTVTNFNAGYSKPTVTIGEGACLELIGTGRMVIGHGATFNITGTISNAKTANTADLTPSLIMPGASFTGAGVTFNVTNAYIKTTASYCSSSSSASGTFDFNIKNSIWEQFGKLAFEAQSTAATVNFYLTGSVLTTTSHLVFGVSRGEIVIDNSNVNVGTSRQIENQSTLTVKNGSVVNGAVATSSNAKNPGTLIIDNATYSVTGEFSGSDLGTGTLIVKNDGSFTAGSITKANIQIDATGMQVGDTVKITANLSKLAGTIEVINASGIDAEIIDGKIVLVEAKVAKIGDNYYSTLADALKAAEEGDTVELLEGTISEGSIKMPATLKNVTIKGAAGHTSILKDTQIMAADGNTYCYEGLTFDGIVFDNSRILVTGWRTGETTLKDWTINNCKFININDDTNEAAVHFNLNAAIETVENFTFTNNVIDGLTGGSKSGIYAAFTGKVTITGNVINNVKFRPLLIQLADCDGVVDQIYVTGNTFSGSSAGRVQIYGSEVDNGDGTWTPSGTDDMSFVLTNNVFKDITTTQQICTWGINAQTVDISKNYYDIDIAAKEEAIYWNNEKSNGAASLSKMGIYPIYTELNADGTINTESIFAPVASVNGIGYATLEEAFKAATSGATITILDDVTIDYYWDCRDTGAKFTVPVTIDGNGKTLKFTNTVYDQGNHYSVFRFEADATVKNLTVDMSEAISGFGGRFRAISAKANLTVDNCTFIGNGSTNNTRAIIYGESAGSAISDVEISITNSTFNGWRRGVSDNENGQDAYIVTVTGNTFTDANVYLSASESVTFTGNTLTKGWVSITSYTASELIVNATGNTLEDNNSTNFNRITNAVTVNADEGFMIPVAEVNGKTYFTLQSAINAAKEGETVTLISNVDVTETVVITQRIMLDLNGNTLSTSVASVLLQNQGGNFWLQNNAETTAKVVTTVTGGVAIYNQTAMIVGDQDIIISAPNGTAFKSESAAMIGGGTWEGALDITSNAATPFLTASISGGTFTADPTEWVSSNCTITKNSDGTYGVVNAVAEVNGVKYATIQAAVDAAEAGDTITVIANVTVDETIDIDKNLTIDLNGFALTAGNNEVNLNISGKLTIKDSMGTGVSTMRNHKVNDGGELVVDGGTLQNIETFNLGFPIYLTSGAKATLNGGIVQAVNNDNYAISVQAGAELTVNEGATINGNWGCINSEGTVLIYGGTFNVTGAIGGHCVYASKGKVTINGGEFNPYEGSTAASYSVFVDGETADVEINGGKFESGVYGVLGSTAGTLTVKGGTFDADPSAYIANGYVVAKKQDGFFAVGVMPNADVENLGAINVTNGTGANQFEGSYFIYDLIGNSGLSSATAPFALQVAMKFTANDTLEQAQANVFSDYTTDFFIQINGIENGSFVANGCYIAGYYPSFEAWVVIPLDGFTIEAGVVYPVISSAGYDFKYTDICNAVGEFTCGIYLTPEILAANPNLTVGLELGLSETIDEALSANFTTVDGYEYEAEELATAFAAKIGDIHYTTFAEAYNAANAGDTITLLADLTLSEILVIDKAIVLDGNGKTLTSTAGRAINVSGADGVTIKNLTINASGERAINVIQNATNVTIENVTAKAANYAVNVASSAADAVVTINDSTLTGLSTVNVAAEGADVTVNDTTINCVDSTTAENYGAITIFDDATNSYVTVNGGEVIVSDDSFAGVVFVTESDIIFNGTAGDTTVKYVVVIINGAGFFSLAEAIEYADIHNVDTITLIRDVTLSETVTVGSGKAITLDLNGYTVSMEDASGAGCYMIKNYGDLTIMDSSENGTGKLTFNSTTPSASYDYSTSTIGNAGNLTIESGLIENTTIGGASYAIDSIWHTKDVSLTINGGEIVANKIAVRQVPYSTTYKNVVTVNGGTLTGETAGLQTFNTSNTVNLAEVNITGGVFNGTYAFYTSYQSANGSAGTTIDISGGEFNGYVFLYNHIYGGAAMDITVTDGEFNGGYYAYTFDVNGNEVGIPSVAGGTFAYPVEEAYCATGYIPVENGDGTYGVKVGEFVARVNGVGYETLQDAFNAAADKDVVKLVTDIALDTTVVNTKEITLDLNGKTITGTDNNTSGNFYLINNNKGNLTITDNVGDGMITLTATNERNWSASSVVVANNLGTVTVKAGTIEHLGGTAMAYGIDNLTNGANTVATLNIEGGKIDSTYFAIRQFANNGTNNLNVTGGEISYAWMQSPNANANVANISVTGGKIDGICLSGNNAVLSLEVAANTTGEVYGTAPTGMVIVGSPETGFGIAKAVAMIGDTYYATFADAYGAAQAGDTLTLLADLTLSEILVIDKAIVLDGNGKTLTSTADRAINVSGADGVTIKNLTINASGERAINVIQNATNVTIENVTAKAANYAVNVASSAAGAVVTINDSTLTGLSTVNVAAANAKVTINDTTINCVDSTTAENYGAITIFDDATNSYVTVNGGEVIVSDDSFAGVVFVTESDIIFNGTAGDTTVKYVVVIINGAGFFSLAEAIEYAYNHNVDTITLIRDVTLSETLTINKAITLDLNGYTVTGADNAIVFEVKAETVITNGTIIGNKSKTSSGLIDIYSDLTLNDVEITTSEINALRFKAGGLTATLTDCTVTGAFKGYGESVWEILSGTYKISSSSISEQLNGTAQVSGGTFEYEISEDKCAEDYEPFDNGDGTWTVQLKPFVAEVNGVQYRTVEKAIAAANAGDTVKLLSDYVGEGLVINKSIVLDLGGYTYTFETSVGSNGTETNAMQILAGSDVTIKNGTLAMVEDKDGDAYTFFTFIRSYANLTLDGVTLDSANGVVPENAEFIALSVTAGTAVLTNGASIINSNKDGFVAIYVADNTLYTGGASVEVEKTAGMIEGKVETDGSTAATLVVMGGTYTQDVLDYCAKGYVCIKNDNGTYGVHEAASIVAVVYDGNAKKIATIESTDYAEVLAQIDALAETNTIGSVIITLNGDVTTAETINIKYTTYIHGEGHTITYTGTDRAIDVRKETGSINLIIDHLSVVAEKAERGINYNTTGKLELNNVNVTAKMYAVNFPSSANGATIEVDHATLTANIALNIWGENMVIKVNESVLTNVDDNAVENYSVIQLNGNGAVANGTTVTVTGGKVIATGDSFATSNWTATGTITISDTTEVVGEQVTMVALVNGYGVISLQDAFDYAVGKGQITVTLIRDITVDQISTLAKGTNVILDLNGFSIIGTDNTTTNFSIIENFGTLTIMDSSTAQTGKITLTATTDGGWDKYSAVISNNPGGVLTVESGLIEHLGGTAMAYAIDNRTNGKGTVAITTINGGTIKSAYIAIRQFLNGIEADNVLTINAGTIDGANSAIYFQDANKNANPGKLVVDANAILTNRVYLGVTGGSTEWPVEISIADAAFASDVTDKVVTANVPAGYSVDNANGTWGVTYTAYEVVGHSVSFDGIIGYNFYVVFNKTDVTVSIKVGDDERINVAVSELASGSITIQGVYYEKCYFVSVPVNAVEMTQTITLNVLDGDKTIELKANTVESYALAVIDINIDEKTNNLMISTLNYGAAAQTLLGKYNSEDLLANRGLTEEQKTLVVDYNANFGEESGYVKAQKTDEDPEDNIKPYGASLLFESETTIRIYFNIVVEEGANIDYKFYIGETELEAVYNSTNYYYVDIANVNAKDLSKKFTVVAKNVEGQEVASLTYSAMDYIETALRETYAENVALQSLAKAMFHYSKAADAYFAK